MSIVFSCRTCDARWSEGAFSDACEECGGGALEHACVWCGGRCGAVWKRAVIDSNDTGTSHWYGTCALPKEERAAVLRERMREFGEGRAGK